MSTGLLPGDHGGLCRASACPAQPGWRLPLTTPAVARPARDHYLPDLHHLRLELEEAATPEGHAVRFGFNPLEFENFSWRGYAQMTPIQVGVAQPQPPARGLSWWAGPCGPRTRLRMAREGRP